MEEGIVGEIFFMEEGIVGGGFFTEGGIVGKFGGGGWGKSF